MSVQRITLTPGADAYSCDGLLGEPDLFGKETGGYIVSDIKSGSGEEGDNDNKKSTKTLADDCYGTYNLYNQVIRLRIMREDIL
ncbi:MAG: hypothetical protein EBX50_18195 [Chitinophagia bacterium]|nr:hypothetical protein [Chitinophagia bacterium]